VDERPFRAVRHTDHGEYGLGTPARPLCVWNTCLMAIDLKWSQVSSGNPEIRMKFRLIQDQEHQDGHIESKSMDKHEGE
jgi:hypothetical protein